MKKFKKPIEVVLVVLVLAVPAWFIYGWWSRRAASSKAQMSTSTTTTTAVFAGQNGEDGAAAPEAPAVAESTSAATGEPLPTPEEPSAAAETAAPDAPEVAAGTVPVSGTIAAQPLAQAATTHAAPALTAEEQLLAFAPKKQRNPFLSPDDVQALLALQKAEAYRIWLQKHNADLAAARAAANSRPGANIEIQGIIGNSAIINGRTVGVGDSVNSAKVLRIGSNFVTMEQYGVRFTKVLKDF